MIFALLEMVKRQFHGFMPPQAACKQNGKQGPIALAFEALVVRRLPQRLPLLRRQPVPQTDSEFLHALDAPDSSGQIGAEETTVGCLVGETPNGTEAQIDGTGSEFARFEMHAVAQNHRLVE